jgi:hypothetical protein
MGGPVRNLPPSAAIPACECLPKERADLAKLIYAFTIHAARAGFAEAATGSLTAGKSADLAVLDRNLFAISPAEISRARVLMTLFEGRTVFREPGRRATRYCPGGQPGAKSLPEGGRSGMAPGAPRAPLAARPYPGRSVRPGGAAGPAID